MSKPSDQSLWGVLHAITGNLKGRRLADVSRFISFVGGEEYSCHRHERIEINYVKKGNCTILLDEENFFFREGELMIIHSGVRHAFTAGQAGCVLLQLEFLPAVFEGFGTNGPESPVFSFEGFFQERGLTRIVRDERIMRAVQRIVLEMSSREKYYRHVVLMYYAELLILIYRYVDKANRPFAGNELLGKSVAYMRENCHLPINVRDVAEQTGVTERYLRKLFARYAATSPLEYLNRLRVDQAVEYLRITELSVKEVAYKCGFTSPPYFSRVFKKYTGVIPKEFLCGKKTGNDALP